MSTKNDDAWQQYIDEMGIRFDQPSYSVIASELMRITNREPRLLAKFDTPQQLPEPIKRAGYSLLPVKNGAYLLLRGNLFEKVPITEDVFYLQPNHPFPLLTIGRGSSESQYIDQAYYDGLFHHFFGISDLYLTIRGREYTGKFSFFFYGQSVDVESVQIEVDAGYEGLRDIILIEAKIGKQENFNIRQMYYPFRHFRTLVPTKNIRNAFFTYDIPTAEFSLYEYRFANEKDPRSISLVKCNNFRIEEEKKLTNFDLIDTSFKTKEGVVPQADDLNRIFELISIIGDGIDNANKVADYFAFELRQSNYYREAAEYLGLVQADSGEYELTDQGIQVLSSSIPDQRKLLAKAVVNSWIFSHLIEIASEDGFFTFTDIEEIIASVKIGDGSQRYSKTTIPRRRQTIVGWIRWLASEIGCFEIDEGKIRLK